MTGLDSDDVSQLKSQDFDVVMKRLMGDKMQRTPRFIETWTLIRASRPKEELLVQAAFESCAFKSALSCVAGEKDSTLLLIAIIEEWFDISSKSKSNVLCRLFVVV